MEWCAGAMVQRRVMDVRTDWGFMMQGWGALPAVGSVCMGFGLKKVLPLLVVAH